MAHMPAAGGRGDRLTRGWDDRVSGSVRRLPPAGRAALLVGRRAGPGHRVRVVTGVRRPDLWSDPAPRRRGPAGAGPGGARVAGQPNL